MWFSGMPRILRRFEQVLFRQTDPISGDAVPVVYTHLVTQMHQAVCLSSSDTGA